jgi:hypothetical protein
MATKSQIMINAEKLQALHDRIRKTFRAHPHGPEHTAACREFHENYNPLAFPGGLDKALRRLKEHDSTVIDEIISFLREDPQYFRSGYHKETMLRRLKGFALTTTQRKSLASLIIRSVENGPRRVYLAYARLSAKLNVSSMETSIIQLGKSNNAEVKRRSQHILEILKQSSGKPNQALKLTVGAHCKIHGEQRFSFPLES